jgi:hypothetical protein
MNDTSRSTGKKAGTQTPVPLTVEETIAQFNVMEPGAEVVMRREMEQLFPSVSAAIEREVSEGQIIAALRQKWPNSHVATLIKVFNAERARRLAQGEPIAFKAFGSPRKPTIRKSTKTTDTSGSTRTTSTAPDAMNSDQLEVSA